LQLLKAAPSTTPSSSATPSSSSASSTTTAATATLAFLDESIIAHLTEHQYGPLRKIQSSE
jgi:hypothetical protein